MNIYDSHLRRIHLSQNCTKCASNKYSMLHFCFTDEHHSHQIGCKLSYSLHHFGMRRRKVEIYRGKNDAIAVCLNS